MDEEMLKKQGLCEVTSEYYKKCATIIMYYLDYTKSASKGKLSDAKIAKIMKLPDPCLKGTFSDRFIINRSNDNPNKFTISIHEEFMYNAPAYQFTLD